MYILKPYQKSITDHMPQSIRFTAQYQVFQETGQPFDFMNQEKVIELNEGEVLIKVVLATLCGSDIHTIEGKRKEDTPCILGHEAVGEIIALNGRDGFSLGDMVTWSIADSCGKCSNCVENKLPEKCHSLFKYGHASINNGTGLNGSYASHILLRKGTHIVKVPLIVSPANAAPANCALATMVNAVSKMTVAPKKAVIQGGGLLGIYTCALLKERGVEEIFCLEVNENRFSLISQFGGIPVDGKNSEQAMNFILERSADGVDVVFEVAGVKELIPQGVQLLRPGGDYILVGLVHPDSALTITAEQIIRKCISITGVHNYAPWHLEESIAFLQRNQKNFPFDKLVSPPFDLQQLDQAISEAKKQAWMRVAIKPN
jgi:putative phosphonate catabolism associated alcohol dehydrogenase